MNANAVKIIAVCSLLLVLSQATPAPTDRELLYNGGFEYNGEHNGTGWDLYWVFTESW